MKPKFVSDTLGFGVGDIILVEGIVPLCYVISEDKIDRRITRVYPLNRYTADKILKKEFSKNIENEIKDNQKNIKTITIGIDKTQSIMTKGYREAITDTDYMAKDIWHPLMSPIEKLRLHAFKPSSNDIDIENESWIKDAFSAIQGLISKGDFYDALKHIINIANTIKTKLHLQSSGTAIKDVTEPQKDTKQYLDYGAVITMFSDNSMSSILYNTENHFDVISEMFPEKNPPKTTYKIINNDGENSITTEIRVLKSLKLFLNAFLHGHAIYNHEPNINICNSIVFWLSQPILYNTQPDIFSDLRDVLIALAQRYLNIKKEQDEEFVRTNANTLLLEKEAAASKQPSEAAIKVLSKEAASKPPHKITASEAPPGAASKPPHKITASKAQPDAAASKTPQAIIPGSNISFSLYKEPAEASAGMTRDLIIVGICYASGNDNLDMKKMTGYGPGHKFGINKPSTTDIELTHSLYIYNENFQEYEDKTSLIFGSGNGFLRLARQDHDPTKKLLGPGEKLSVPNKSLKEPKVKSLGIPTGVTGGSLADVHKSIVYIYNYIVDAKKEHAQIKTVYYSSGPISDKIELGIGTFAGMDWTKKNTNAINDYLFTLFKELSKAFNVKILHRSEIGTKDITGLLGEYIPTHIYSPPSPKKQ
jgi:hypothetical protein